MTSGSPTPESHDLRVYLDYTDILDWRTHEVQSLADMLVAGESSDVEKAKRLYEWVRDEIPHSSDAGHETVTCRASEVLRHRTGICFAKAHLLAALLRSVGVPCGLCYQLLRYEPTSERLVVHGLNGIFLESLGRWVRADPRGNKPGVNAQFSLEHEQLAFHVTPALGESTCETVFARPVPVIVQCLMSHQSVTELLADLPSSIDHTPTGQ